jgi:hypothetical protein
MPTKGASHELGAKQAVPCGIREIEKIHPAQLRKPSQVTRQAVD